MTTLRQIKEEMGEDLLHHILHPDGSVTVEPWPDDKLRKW